jgi:hypothetical protein
MRRMLLALLSGLVLFGGWPSPATAASSNGLEVLVGARTAVSHSDGNDTNGPLDLSGVSIAQGPNNEQIYKLTTIHPFAISDINVGPNGVVGNFFVGIDTNNDKKLNYRLYLYNSHGLRGVLVKGSNVVSRSIGVSRPNQHTIQAKLPLSKIGHPTTYWVLAASVSSTGSGCSQQKPCVDYIPNRYPLILDDFTPPSINNVTVPTVASDTTYGVSFTVNEVGNGSGVKKWTIQRHVGGSWIDVISGSTSGSISTQVPSAEGNTDNLRVMATDKAGNTSVSSSQPVIVPFDDSNAAAVYTHPGVDWSHPSSVDAYLGASHLSVGAGSVVTVTYTGGSFCVLGGPVAGGLGSAQVSIDGASASTVGFEGPSTPAQANLGCVGAIGVGAHTVTITTDDVFNFDGFYTT